MPFCPNCRTEYVGSATRCGDCGAELVASLAQGGSAGARSEATRATELCELSDQVQLDLLETQLRAAGIPCVRRPRAVALFVPAARLEEAQRLMRGEPAAGMPNTLGLSELHRLRLTCSECDEETIVDVLEDQAPEACSCGHRFDLTAVRPVLDRYADLMRTMADADFEIELEPPEREE